MSDYSGNLDFSPTRQAKIAAAKSLEIQSLSMQAFTSHFSMKPIKFTYSRGAAKIYRMSTQAMAMKRK
ncbi:hypothetical protein TNIN_183931, partial [Trichonephila inaurata madagascariensis]